MFGNIDLSSPIVNFESFELGQIGTAFFYGGSILLIGMATVFSVLCLLWLCLTIFKLCFHTIPNKRAKKKKAEVVTPVVTKAPVEVKQQDDGEIIAVIAAAIAMAESEDSGMKFRVVSFKRV